jgi:hypothetical protein
LVNEEEMMPKKKATKQRRKRTLRMKSPASVIPRSWKQAKVRRLKNGRVQVMISGGSRNPKSTYRVIRATGRHAWGAGKGGKAWIILDSQGRQVSGFYKTKKTASSQARIMQRALEKHYQRGY